MNKLFAIIFIAAISFLVFTGRSELASNSLLEIPLEGIKLVINTSASVMLFSGLLQVAYDCGIIKHLTSFLRNPMSHLFLSLNNDDIDIISLNLLCNFLGINGAATSAGLKAMESLVAKKDYNAIITFLTLNASGFCLLPQGILAIRGSYINNAFDIILPSFLLSLLAFIITICLNKVLVKYDK
ncbi:MAG: hypothetical protein HP024_02025 [Acholeplasmatales bacterium]|nr:hypothetical protein [Acholeplasmatales bacterium]